MVILTGWCMTLEQSAKRRLRMLAFVQGLRFLANASSGIVPLSPAEAIMRLAEMSFVHQLKSASNKQIARSLLM